MYCVKQITNDITWVGGNDRRLAMFEGVYSVPRGVSYNSYLLMDKSTVLFDTVDKSITEIFFENIEYVLAGRKLDYVVIQHMEPDHSASLAALLLHYPMVRIVCNDKTANMIKQFLRKDVKDTALIVDESSVLDTGTHKIHFRMAPMVHWPEVMVSYDSTDKVLFSADAFGTFGALNGAMFADEVNFERDYLDEARRYYCNIVGKYGNQVQALLKKASQLDIRIICPLHGFVWRNNIGAYIEKYMLWSTYTPEENAVMIAYASIYGNTERAAEILSSELCNRGVKTVMYDVSVTPASEVVAAAFRYSHLVFASSTYNAGIFVSMDELLRDLAAHNIQKRTVAFIENGSWAATSGKLMREIISSCKNMTILDDVISIKSSLNDEQRDKLIALAEKISETLGVKKIDTNVALNQEGEIDAKAMIKLSYGLFVLTAKENDKDNGCIINTVSQITSSPNRIMIAVNKSNYTNQMIKNTGVFNLSVLSEKSSFDIFKRFGFQSGRDVNKFENTQGCTRTQNGLMGIIENTNAVISAKVIDSYDYDTHTVFIAQVTEAAVLSQEPSVTYAYYFENIKPKPAAAAEKKKGFVCKICGYVYEGDVLPDDFICPLCKHGAEDFEPLS